MYYIYLLFAGDTYYNLLLSDQMNAVDFQVFNCGIFLLLVAGAPPYGHPFKKRPLRHYCAGHYFSSPNKTSFSHFSILRRETRVTV